MGDQTNPPERWTLRGLGGGRQVTAAGGPAIRLNERRDVVDAAAYDRVVAERDEAREALSKIARRFWHEHSSGLTAYEAPALNAVQANSVACDALPADMLDDPCRECGGTGVQKADNYRRFEDRPCRACGGTGNAPRAALDEGEQPAGETTRDEQDAEDGRSIAEWDAVLAEHDGDPPAELMAPAGVQSTTETVRDWSAAVDVERRIRERHETARASTTETATDEQDYKPNPNAVERVAQLLHEQEPNTRGTWGFLMGKTRDHLRWRARLLLAAAHRAAAPATPEGTDA